MKRVLLVLLLMASLGAQELPPGMKVYYFVLLTKGPNRTQSEAEAEAIQRGHMANIERLHAEGKLDLAGPFMDDGDWRGLFVLRVTSEEEARKLLETDPAISSGRLRYEIHPWLGKTGEGLR